MYQEPCLAGILRELDGLVGILHALVDVLEHHGACAFKAYAHFAAAGLFHELEQIERDIGAGVAAPRNLETTFQDQVADFAHVLVACGKRIVFEEHFTEVLEVFLDVLQFVDHVFGRAAAEPVTVQRLRNHAVAAAVRATATRENHDQRVEVCAVEILLVAAVEVLAVDLRHPREFVEVLDLRAFGLEIGRAVFLAEGKARDACNIFDVAAQVAYEVPRGVVRLADNHEVERGFHLHGFKRFGRRVRTHDGDLRARQFVLDGVHDVEVVQDTRRTRTADDQCRVKLLDAVECLREVQFHGGAVDELYLVVVGFDSAGGITQEHGPIKCRRFGHARTARLTTEHRMERRI